MNRSNPASIAPAPAQRVVLFLAGCAACLCLLLAAEPRALAYVDPGTGFVALQSLFAGLAAFGYFMRRRLAALFHRNERAGKKPVAVEKPSAAASARKEDARNAA